MVALSNRLCKRFLAPRPEKDNVPDHRHAQANLAFVISIVGTATIDGFRFRYDSGGINRTQNGAAEGCEQGGPTSTRSPGVFDLVAPRASSRRSTRRSPGGPGS
jgi:hypothetical protein